MRKKARIVSYSAEALAAMRERGEDKTDWETAKAKTQAELAADMASDSAWQGVSEDWVKQAHVATGLMRRPKENKRQVTVRFDADVLDYFRGRGGVGRDALTRCSAASWKAIRRIPQRRLDDAFG